MNSITRRIIIPVFLLSLFMVISPLFAAEKGVGMVLETSGKVTIDGKKAMLMQPLFPGNVVKTGIDGSISIASYIDDREYFIDRQSEIEMGVKSFKAKIGSIKIVSGNNRIPLPKNTVLISRKISGEFFRIWPLQEKALNISMPRDGMILTSNKVQFQWSGTTDFYKTDIIHKEAKTHLKDFPEIRKYKDLPTEFEYELEYGKSYIFKVREMDNELDDTGKELHVTFQILPELEASRIREVENGFEEIIKERKIDRKKATLLMIDFYTEKKMYHQALNLLDQLKSMDTDNPYVFYYMAEIYGKMGKTNEAEAMIREGNKLEEKASKKEK